MFILVLFLSTVTRSTPGQTIDSLKMLIKDIQRGANDSIRFASNDLFLAGFEKLLQRNGSFQEKFDSLKNVSIVTSEDNQVRLFTWLLPYYDGHRYDYYGFIQYKVNTRDTLLRLQDSTRGINKPESEKLTTDRWLGCIYYHIIKVTRSRKTYYTLLGWKARDETFSQKIIEILYFDKDKAKFGFPLIKAGSIFKNRMVFTFNALATMTLHYDKKYKGIVFDHLSSNKNNPSQIIGPDGTYDALKYKKRKWILYRDVDVRTLWEPKKEYAEPPPE
jgi:hypothetical protein